MRPEIDVRWIEYFRGNGFPAARGLSAGMEGAVYSLVENELIAKVWLGRNKSELCRLKTFCDALKLSAGAIRTPEIEDIKVVDGVLITFERFLRGEPLQSRLSGDAAHADAFAVTALITVLEFLRTVPPLPAFRTLAVLDESGSSWRDAATWGDAIESLIEGRMRRFGSQLQSELPDLGRIRKGVQDFLRTRERGEMSLVHGDLCGANIMVDDDNRPLSVFDFGFMTTVGDPLFDASISSAIFNMYGPHARRIDDEVTDAVVAALGYPRPALLAYRAVYSLITSNAYSATGDDGHFRWCVTMLKREDVRASIGL